MRTRTALLGFLLFLMLACSGGEQAAEGEQHARGAGAQTDAGPDAHSDVTIFRRYTDRTENAFTILVPDGWQTEGGIVRVDPTAAGGAAQSIEAKLDFAIKKDDAGTVMVRWLPHIYYADLRGQPAAGMFPAGSNYGGMTVMPLMGPIDFAVDMAFPYLRGSARRIERIESQSLPDLARLYQRLFDEGIGNALGGMIQIGYEAGYVTLEYDEGGTRFRETLVVVIEDRGPAVAGQWCNRLTIALRAPAAEHERWAPLADVILTSTEIEPRWVAGELRGQMTRGQIAIDTQRQVQEIERAMVEHRRQTNAEIHNDVFLTLTEQEEYVNPWTGEVETGSNQWHHRWQNEQGDVLYTDEESYDPNSDPFLHEKGFKRTPVRPRKP
jgi:hypothetical protein